LPIDTVFLLRKELLTPTAVQIRSDSHNNCCTFESHKACRQKIGLIWPTIPPEMCPHHIYSHTSSTPASETGKTHQTS